MKNQNCQLGLAVFILRVAGTNPSTASFFGEKENETPWLARFNCLLVGVTWCLGIARAWIAKDCRLQLFVLDKRRIRTLASPHQAGHVHRYVTPVAMTESPRSGNNERLKGKRSSWGGGNRQQVTCR